MTWAGGHNVNPALLKRYEARIGGVLSLGYSRTEGGLAYNPIDRAERRFDHNGFTNRNSTDLRIWNHAERRPCATGESGEILVAGDGVSPGYWDGGMVRVPVLVDGRWST